MFTEEQENILSSLNGTWCSNLKREASIKLSKKAKLIVEIGTFGGSWLLPMALANPQTRCIGIDPYSAGTCVEGMTTEANIQWWNDQKMLDGVYRKLLTDIHSLQLENVNIIKSPSEDVVSQFEDNSIDIFHSDANHSLEPTLRNAKLYLSKIKVGGIFIQDDIGWSEMQDSKATMTVQPAIDWLLENGCEWMYEVTGSGFMRRVK